VVRELGALPRAGSAHVHLQPHDALEANHLRQPAQARQCSAAVEADGFTVVCADGRFKVTRVQPADGKKIDAGEWAKSANIAAKARFT
jgi:methionyl-tRNA formyltransferase